MSAPALPLFAGVVDATGVRALDPLRSWVGRYVEVATAGTAVVALAHGHAVRLDPVEGDFSRLGVHHVVRVARQEGATWLRAVAAVAGVDALGRLVLGPSEVEAVSQRVDDRVAASPAVTCWWVDADGVEHDAAGETADLGVGGCSAWLDPPPPVGVDVALAVALGERWWSLVARCAGRLGDGRTRFEITGATPEAAGALASFVIQRQQHHGERVSPVAGCPTGSIVRVRLWGRARPAEVLDAEVSAFGLALLGLPDGFEPGEGVVIGVQSGPGDTRLAAARVVSRAGGKLRLAWA